MGAVTTRPRRAQAMSPHEWADHKDQLCARCRHNTRRGGGCQIMWWIDRDLADVPASRVFHGGLCSQWEGRPAKGEAEHA